MKLGYALALVLSVAGFVSSPVRAAADDILELMSMEKTLHYQKDDVVVGSNLATLHLGSDYRFLNAEDARKVIVDAWGNPPAAANDVLGMITPGKTSVLAPAGWGVVLTYDDEGHIDDADAEGIDYPQLLSQLQKGTEASNAKRKEAGFPGMHLVGWAKTPSYDTSAKKLIWAKELSFDGGEEHTLNYDVRVLGREGVLSMNAVGTMPQLAELEQVMAQVAAKTEFNAGQRYADYKHGTDRLATYGVAGLIAGGVAAKAGLFKGLLLALLAAKKLLIVAVVAIVAVLKKVLDVITGKSAAKSPTPPAA